MLPGLLIVAWPASGLSPMLIVGVGPILAVDVLAVVAQSCFHGCQYKAQRLLDPFSLSDLSTATAKSGYRVRARYEEPVTHNP